LLNSVFLLSINIPLVYQFQGEPGMIEGVGSGDGVRIIAVKYTF